MRSLYEFGRFSLDPDEHRLTLDGTPVPITPKAFDILVVLVRRAPRLVPKDQLLKEVWPDSYVEEANLSVHISALRRLLSESDQDRYIETVPRRGYRFIAPVRVLELADATPERVQDSDDATEVVGVAETTEPIAGSPVTPTPVIEAPPRVEAVRDPVDSRARSRWLIVGLTTLAAAAVIAATLSLSTSLARNGDLVWERIASEGKLSRVMGSDSTTFETGSAEPAISPDGRGLAYVLTDEKGRSDLYVTRVAGGGQLRLTDDDATEQNPRFSPDGERILFTRLEPKSLGRVSEIRVVPALGGESRVVTQGMHATWSPKADRIAYIHQVVPDGPPALFTSASDGSDVREVLAASPLYPYMRRPAWSRDGRIAVVRSTGGIAGEIWLVPETGGGPQRLTQTPAEVWCDSPSFTPDSGGVLYTSNRGGAINLWVQLFDGNRMVRLTTGPGPEEFPTISDTGLISFLGSRHRAELIVHSPATEATRTLMSHAPFLWAPAFSPDMREIAFSRGEVDGSWHLWTIAADDKTTPRQLTSGTLGELHPRYMPDGESVVYHTWGRPRHIWRVPREGGSPVQLTFGDHDDGYADPSPDGKLLAFARTGGVERVHIVSLAGGDARPLTVRPSSVPRWSPDGRLIAFSANRRYDGGIFVIAPDGSGQRRLTDVGGWPVWWPDGSQIGYIAVGPNGSQQIWSVPVNGGSPRLIDTLTFDGQNFPFDVAHDGRRVVTTRGVRVSREIWLLQPPR